MKNQADKPTSQRPILVTGAHRSGTTWTGHMLATAPGTAYIHEPFNIMDRVSYMPKPFEHWYQYIEGQQAVQYEPVMRDILQLQFPLRENLLRAGCMTASLPVIKQHLIAWWLRKHHARVIMKDPFALFSAEWLNHTFNMNVLIMIRHPAAFCSSLKVKDWKFNFNHLLNQPNLMRDYLMPFNYEIRHYARNRQDIIDQGILLWNCLHHTIHLFRTRHTDWLFVRHEDLSLRPEEVFRRIFNAVQLPFARKTITAIQQSSGPHNSAEQQPRKEYFRNSRKNVDNWKTRLTAAEITRIRKGTARVAARFYDDNAW